MALLVPRQKNQDHFLMPTFPQNGVEHVCFMRLALLGGFLANLKIWLIRRRFTLLKRPKFQGQMYP